MGGPCALARSWAARGQGPAFCGEHPEQNSEARQPSLGPPPPPEWPQYHPLAPNKLQPCGERRFYTSRYF